MTAEQTAIDDEQRRLDEMFARRDELLAVTERELRHLLDERLESGRDHVEAQARARHLRRRVELDRADRGLCFGRLDETDGEHLHVGRMGLPSPDADADPLLIDWRAPAARPFYAATAARPLGLRGRRHIRTDGREVLGVDDDRFDRSVTSGDDLVGEATLLAALDAPDRSDARRGGDAAGRAGRDHPGAAGRLPRRPGGTGHRHDGRRAAPCGLPAVLLRGARRARRARRRPVGRVPRLHRPGAALPRRDPGDGDPEGSGEGSGVGAEAAGDRVLAEVALRDRRWAYGHVIVDEAEELSPMQWRMLRRRCPPGSFTVVGDVNQTEAPGGTRSWPAVLDPVFGDRWRQAEVTISYRTPREVMERTAPVLRAAGSTVDAPRAVRSNGRAPWRRDVDVADLPGAVGTALRELHGRYAGGRVAVVAPEARHDVLRPVVEPGGAR